MAARDLHTVEAALRAVADACSGHESLAATGALGAATLAAAGVPPEAQLTTLLRLAEAPQQAADQPQLQRLLAAAAVQPLTCPQPSPASAAAAAATMELLLLPQLAAECAADDAAAQQWQRGLEQAVADVVARCGCWGTGLALVHAAVGSPGAPPSRLPAHVAVRLAAATIQGALQAGNPEGDPSQQPGREELLRYAATDAVPAVLALASAAPSQQDRRARAKGGQPAEAAQAAAAAARTLLPAVLQAACQQGQEAAALQQLWDMCK